MNAKEIFIDGQNILATGVYYTAKNWSELAVSDESRDIAGMHGRVVSPTYARVRIITLEGYIDRRESDFPAVEHLQYMFRLQRHIEAVDTRLVSLIDEYNRKWNIKAKIKEPLVLEEGDGEWAGEYYRWRVVLESVGGAEFTSDAETRVPETWYGSEGTYGGVSFGTSFWVPLDSSISSIDIFSSSNFDIPLRIVLECIDSWNAHAWVQSPIVVQNAKNGSSFRLDTTMVPWDIVEINSGNLTVTKNGSDITINRIPWSVFPSVYGNTRFIVSDADGRILSNDLRVSAYFFNALL